MTQVDRTSTGSTTAATSDPRTGGQLALALSDQVGRLVRDHLALAQAEVKSSVTRLGAGAGMLAAAGFLGFCLLICLLVAGGLGLAVYFAAWLAALIEAGVFLLLAAVLALLGLKSIKKGGSPVPKAELDALKADLQIVKGIKP